MNPIFKIHFSRFQEYAGEHQAPSVVLQFQVSLYRPQMIVLPRRALPYLYVLEFGVQAARKFSSGLRTDAQGLRHMTRGHARSVPAARRRIVGIA